MRFGGLPRTEITYRALDLTVFALLTGARRNEMAALTWDRVNINDDDPADCWWHLDDRKRGDPLWLPLSFQSVALLKGPSPAESCRTAPTARSSSRAWGKNWPHRGCPAPPWSWSARIVGKHLSLPRLPPLVLQLRHARVSHRQVRDRPPHWPQACRRRRDRQGLLLDLERLDWLYPEVQKIGDWIEQQGRLTAAKANGENVVALRA